MQPPWMNASTNENDATSKSNMRVITPFQYIKWRHGRTATEKGHAGVVIADNNQTSRIKTVAA